MKKFKKINKFYAGLTIGLLGGVIGNILVTSMYRMIGETTKYIDMITFFIALFIGIFLIYLFTKGFNKS